MITYERVIITEDDFPEWKKPSNFMMKCINEDSDDILPWFFITKFNLIQANTAIKKNYPTRDLFIFAHREDSDDVACFEKSKPGKVIIVHDWEDEGYEIGPEFVSFEAWYAYALASENGEHSYENVPGIDFYPY